MTEEGNPGAQASGGLSFPPVNYGGWGQGHAAGRKKAEDNNSLDQSIGEDDEEPENNETSTQDIAQQDGEVDEPAESGGSKTSRFLERFGQVIMGAGAAAKQGVVMARRYPRVSMASGLSLAILGAVVILQPGKGKHDTPAQIPAAGAQKHTPLQTQNDKTDPAAPSITSSSAAKTDHPRRALARRLARKPAPLPAASCQFCLAAQTLLSALDVPLRRPAIQGLRPKRKMN